MATEKQFILSATKPQPDGSIFCIFNIEEAEPHLFVVPRFVGPNKDIPSNRPYLRHMLDRAADQLGYARCTDEDWQTILDVCHMVWGELPPDPEWTPPTEEELQVVAQLPVQADTQIGRDLSAVGETAEPLTQSQFDILSARLTALEGKLK